MRAPPRKRDHASAASAPSTMVRTHACLPLARLVCSTGAAVVVCTTTLMTGAETPMVPVTMASMPGTALAWSVSVFVSVEDAPSVVFKEAAVTPGGVVIVAVTLTEPCVITILTCSLFTLLPASCAKAVFMFSTNAAFIVVLELSAAKSTPETVKVITTVGAGVVTAIVVVPLAVATVVPAMVVVVAPAAAVVVAAPAPAVVAFAEP